MIKITPITNAEIHTLQTIGRQTFYETFHKQNTEENMNTYLESAFEVSKLDSELNNPNSFFYFAKVNGEAAGYLKLNVLDAQSEQKGEHALEVERIYILESFQGHGIGKLFIEKAVDLAREVNKQSVWLGVWEKNVKAIGFYEKMGFMKAGEHVFLMGDEAQTDYIMEKSI